MVSIPDWGVTPFAKDRDQDIIAREIDLFNKICKDESLKAGADFIDVTDISRKVHLDAELVAKDGLHPSAKMYSQWVDRLLPQILKMIEK